jgi:hypothetical protein
MHDANQQMLNRRRFLRYVGAGALAGVGGFVIPAATQGSITYAS